MAKDASLCRKIVSKKANIHYFQCLFQISLRADDLKIIKLIQSFLGCGHIMIGKSQTKTNKKSRPSAIIRVFKLQELISIVIPMFEKYPLLAKKNRDFMIWKQAVALQYKVMTRPFTYIKGRHGRLPKHTSADTDQLRLLHAALSKQRSYCSVDLDIASTISLHVDNTFPLFE